MVSFLKKIKGVDFVCFTDNVEKVPKPWKVILSLGEKRGTYKDNSKKKNK